MKRTTELTDLRRALSLLPLLALVALFPGEPGQAAPSQEAAIKAGATALKARAILKKYCAECHTGENDSRSRLSILDHRQLVAEDRPVRSVDPDSPLKSQILEFIEDGSMPPAGRKRPSAEEVTTLKNWLTAKAPFFPIRNDDKWVLETIRADFRKLTPEEAPAIRYVSFAHLASDSDPSAKIFEFLETIDAFTQDGDRSRPVSVDSTSLIFRFDLRRYGWHETELFESVDIQSGRPTPSTLIPFDLILLEDPHATYPGAEDSPFLESSRGVRPTVYLRGDWLTTLLKSPPVADEMKSLAELARARRKQERCVGPTPRNFEKVPDWTQSPPLPGQPEAILPLSAVRLGNLASEKKPFQLEASVQIHTAKNPVTEVVVDQPFAIGMKANRNVEFDLLNVISDGEIRVAETKENRAIADKSMRLSPKNAAGFRISSLLTGGDAATEYFILVASDGGHPAPTLVRSRHDDKPIWRFVYKFPRTPPKPGDFDPNRCVRVVLPLIVKSKK